MTVAGDKGCGIKLEKLLSYLDGELKGAACRELEHHLEECRQCAACREILEKTISLCRGKTTRPQDIKMKFLKNFFFFVTFR